MVFTGGQISPLGKWAAETCHVVVAEGNDIFPIGSIITLQLSILESAKHLGWCQSVLRCSQTPGWGQHHQHFHQHHHHHRYSMFHILTWAAFNLSSPDHFPLLNSLARLTHILSCTDLGSELVVVQLPTCALPGIDC